MKLTLMHVRSKEFRVGKEFGIWEEAYQSTLTCEGMSRCIH